MNGLDVASGSSEHFLRLRVEFQGAESTRFLSFLGRKNVVPGAEDRVDLFMMRRKRMAYYLADDEEENEEETK